MSIGRGEKPPQLNFARRFFDRLVNMAGRNNQENPSWQELVGTLQRPGITPKSERKILLTLLAPNNTHAYQDWIEQLSGEQAGFIASNLPKHIKQAETIVQEGGYNSLIASRILFDYNYLIPLLLGKLPLKQAEKLFPNFKINDPLPYSSEDFASGYNPLQRLYSNRTVDEVWKRKAASRMHDTIEQELKGQQPRAEHEVAVNNYRRILSSLMLYKEELPISREFYRDEITFMLSVQTGRPIVDPWYTGRVLDLLDDPDLRYKFARRQILSPAGGLVDEFRVDIAGEAATAQRIIAEFPEDTELRIYLEKQLTRWNVRFEPKKSK